MSPVYEFMGLTVGSSSTICLTTKPVQITPADITYVTNNEIGFDYLRDKMVISKEDRSSKS